jgi:hypothetical protein
MPGTRRNSLRCSGMFAFGASARLQGRVAGIALRERKLHSTAHSSAWTQPSWMSGRDCRKPIFEAPYVK